MIQETTKVLCTSLLVFGVTLNIPL